MVERPLPDLVDWIEAMYDGIVLQPWQREMLMHLQREADRRIAERKAK